MSSVRKACPVNGNLFTSQIRSDCRKELHEVVVVRLMNIRRTAMLSRESIDKFLSRLVTGRRVEGWRSVEALFGLLTDSEDFGSSNAPYERKVPS